MKICRSIISAVIVAIFLFSFFCGRFLINKKHEYMEEKEYSGIIELWHVDTFEGGKGSRKQFLENELKQFEKENNGLLISVKEFTIEGVKENFDKEIYPDLISFSNGVEIKNCSNLNIDKTFSAGKIGNKQVLIPWCKGNYLLISKNQNVLNSNTFEKLYVSKKNYNLPLISIFNTDITVKSYEINNPQYTFQNFCLEKDAVLLGTQRDVIRLINKNESFFYKKLDNFCDLYQYLAITSNNSKNKDVCDKIIKYLLTEKVQKSLNKIGMYSEYYDVEYDNEIQNSLNQKCKKTVSPFYNKENYVEINNICIKCLSKDEDAQKKVEKMLICC